MEGAVPPGEAIWAWVRAYELAPGQPAPQSLLPDEGFRITGVLQVQPDGSEGVTSESSIAEVMGVEIPAYRVTGTVVGVEALQVDYGSGPEEIGTELELSVRGDVVYARVKDRGVTVDPGSLVTVRGAFEHIDDHEVDAFPGSGHAWVIEQVQELTDGDALILVRRA